MGGSILPDIGSARRGYIERYRGAGTNGLVGAKIHHRKWPEVDINSIARAAIIHGYRYAVRTIGSGSEGRAGGTILPNVTASWCGCVQHHRDVRTNVDVRTKIHHGKGRVRDVHCITGGAVVPCYLHRIGSWAGDRVAAVHTTILPYVGRTRQCSVQCHRLAYAERLVRPQVHRGQCVVVHRDRIGGGAPVGGYRYTVGSLTANHETRVGGAVLPQVGTARNGSVQHQVLPVA